jgi:hypothetical protein
MRFETEMASIEARYIASYVVDAANEPQAGDASLVAQTLLKVLGLGTGVSADQLATHLQTLLGERGLPSLD